MNDMMLGGMRIMESANAVLRQQVKVYPKRRAKNASHLQRMNNKWRSRYGFTYKPGMFRISMDLGLFGFGRGEVLFVHPLLMPELRRAFPTDGQHGK